MNLEELIKIKEKLEKEKNKCNIDASEFNKVIFNEIAKEIKKIDNIINIYKVQDKKYIVMKLERLYMMILSNLDEGKFNSLTDDKQFEIFDKNFPDDWEYKYSIEEKEQLLLNAIGSKEKIKLSIVK